MRIRTGALRSTIVLMVAAISLMVMAMPALAQYPPAPTTDEAAGPEEAEPGSEVTFQADGFQPDTEATVTITGVIQDTATVTVNDQGVAAYTFTIECDAQSGEATITFTGTGTNGAARTVDTTFTVTQDEAAVCEEESPPAEEPPAEEPPAEEPPAQPEEPQPAPEPGDDGDGGIGGEGDEAGGVDEADEDGLAATGGEFTTGALIAVFALLLGAGLLIAGRRRRETGGN